MFSSASSISGLTIASTSSFHGPGQPRASNSSAPALESLSRFTLLTVNQAYAQRVPQHRSPWISASDVLLASGTKWSQKPIESLPAACAVLTNGAAIIVVDAAADVAINRRRVNIFPLIVFAPFCARAASG